MTIASTVYRRDMKETVISVIYNDSGRDELTEEQLQWKKGSVYALFTVHETTETQIIEIRDIQNH